MVYRFPQARKLLAGEVTYRHSLIGVASVYNIELGVVVGRKYECGFGAVGESILGRGRRFASLPGSLTSLEARRPMLDEMLEESARCDSQLVTSDTNVLHEDGGRALGYGGAGIKHAGGRAGILGWYGEVGGESPRYSHLGQDADTNHGASHDVAGQCAGLVP